MAIQTRISRRDARRRRGLGLAVAATSVALLAGFGGIELETPARPVPVEHAEEHEEEEHEEEGYVSGSSRKQDPDAIELAFARESYRPGETATVRVWTSLPEASIRVYRVGPERVPTIGDKTMQGVAVGTSTSAPLRRGTTISIRIGDWRSGLYFAKATGYGKTGFAPFVVAPTHLGTARVAVVMPTRTWQAYNFRDDDGDSRGNTWYADWRSEKKQARRGRPYLNRGVPAHFRSYDLPFLNWLHRTGRAHDVLSQAELDASTGAELEEAYDLIVFPGHHEYVTKREFDAIESYRNLGGNLAFLAANNFFWRIDLEGDVMTRVAQWRDLGRPEAGVIGVQYIGNDRGQHRGPWIVKDATAAEWLFDGVALKDGREFSSAGIEIDAVAPSSPRGTQVVADVPNLLGPGKTAQMTYYETPAGARVFAAGAFTLAGYLKQQAVQKLVANLWTRMTSEQL